MYKHYAQVTECNYQNQALVCLWRLLVKASMDSPQILQTYMTHVSSEPQKNIENWTSCTKHSVHLCSYVAKRCHIVYHLLM